MSGKPLLLKSGAGCHGFLLDSRQPLHLLASSSPSSGQHLLRVTSQGPSYLWRNFWAFCWPWADPTTGRQWLPLSSEKELVFYLRISLSFESMFSGWLGRHARVCFLFFVSFFFLTCSSVWGDSGLSPLWNENKWPYFRSNIENSFSDK